MGRPPGPTRYSEERKLQILRFVEDLLVDGTFRDTTMDAVAERMGMAKSTLYHYFPKKDDLLYALFDETLTKLITAYRRRLDMDMPPSQQIYECMCDVMELTALSPGRARVLYEHKRTLAPEQVEKLTGMEREYFELISDSIAKGIAAGELRPMEPVMAAHAVTAMVAHSRYWYSPDGPLAPREVAYQFWRIFMDGARSTES